MTTDVLTQVAFGIIALVTLGAAIGVVTARSVFVSALWLILSFVGIAGLYVMLGAGFLAAIQILIYVGAISVLILFAVMLTHNVMETRERANSQWSLGLLLALSLFGLLAVVGFSANWPLTEGRLTPPGGVTVAADVAKTVPAAAAATADGGAAVFILPGQVVMLGRAFMNEHLLAFEVISMILLVALVGAIVIARE